MSCKVITIGCYLSRFLPSIVPHFGSLLVLCTNFDDYLESQSFITASPGCVCTEYRAKLNISESLNQKVTGIKKSLNSD